MAPPAEPSSPSSGGGAGATLMQGFLHKKASGKRDMMRFRFGASHAWAKRYFILVPSHDGSPPLLACVNLRHRTAAPAPRRHAPRRVRSWHRATRLAPYTRTLFLTTRVPATCPKRRNAQTASRGGGATCSFRSRARARAVAHAVRSPTPCVDAPRIESPASSSRRRRRSYFAAEPSAATREAISLGVGVEAALKGEKSGVVLLDSADCATAEVGFSPERAVGRSSSDRPSVVDAESASSSRSAVGQRARGCCHRAAWIAASYAPGIIPADAAAAGRSAPRSHFSSPLSSPGRRRGAREGRQGADQVWLLGRPPRARAALPRGRDRRVARRVVRRDRRRRRPRRRRRRTSLGHAGDAPPLALADVRGAAGESPPFLVSPRLPARWRRFQRSATGVTQTCVCDRSRTLFPGAAGRRGRASRR
jgi:hypothetical protein